MTAFIVLAVLMTAAAVAFVARPLLKPARVADEGPKPAADRRAVAVIGLLVPLAAAALYVSLSNWPWDPAAQITAANPHAGMAGGQAGSIEEAMKNLEQRLVQQPDDVEGWKILARTYIVTEHFDKAREAYARAVALTGGQDMDAVLGEAEAQVLVDETAFDGAAGATFERAAQADPTNPRALWYSGITAYRKQDWKLARERWAALSAMDVPPNIKQLLAERLAELDGKLGNAPATAAAAVPAATPPAMAAAASAPPTTAAAMAGKVIRLRVDIAPTLKSRLRPDAPLFILGRSAQGGPPVAVVRRTAGELPFELTLTDQNVMTQGMTLGMFDELTIVARVSYSGRPQATSGDLFGEIRYDFKGDKPVALNIDRVVP